MAGPKIIVFDIETLPDLKAALKVWPQLSDYPFRTLTAQISSVLCIGYKNLWEPETHILKAWDFHRWDRNINDDFSILKAFRDEIKDADAVVTHNGKSFDWKHIQTRFLMNGIEPLGKIQHIDTKQIAKQNFKFFNNRLGNLGEVLVDDQKMENGGWDLWVKCHDKDPEALELMAKYCIQDVVLLEKILKPMMPVAKMPNQNNFTITDKMLCPNCGSSRLKSNGWRHTTTKSYKRMICVDCHTWSRLNAKGKEPRTL